MKKLIVTLVLCFIACLAQAQNVIVSNTARADTSTALENSHIFKASAGKLVSFSVFNANVSAQFIFIVDSATVPAEGPITAKLLYPCIRIPAVGIASLNLWIPISAANGITFFNSSTGSFTKTIGISDCIFQAQFN